MVQITRSFLCCFFREQSSLVGRASLVGFCFLLSGMLISGTSQGSYRLSDDPGYPSKPVLPALCYATETWGDTIATPRTLRTTHRVLERSILKCNQRTQLRDLRDRLRSSKARRMSHLRGSTDQMQEAKCKWADHFEQTTRPMYEKSSGVESERRVLVVVDDLPQSELLRWSHGSSNWQFS